MKTIYHSLPLSRRGLFAGFLPLSVLAGKLERLGESAALRELSSLSLSMTERVRFITNGTILQVQTRSDNMWERADTVISSLLRGAV